MLHRFIIFGFLGMLAEIIFGALKEILRHRDFQLIGQTSLWVFPLYGLIAFLFPLLAHRVGEFPWWGRGLIYMMAFSLVQYVSGWVLDRFGLCPWHFASKYSINGLVSFLQLPLWFGAGLLVEWSYPYIMAMSQQ
ncbi:MAG: hypothetical protein A3I05_00305 [Deltaproteobacteria bacterium RIFCSPLOWO2_02_FULL_44_10]|nr:MAG: hypothetical protein A3C46_01170 [Deltaproteobacteria bacterium RIFCSPHIGHO2_02_FULL_44_16]OGQ47293.1 MAG: hypothetical protein A3I05_00305 [Deltaproteobacteria bacterium RIFCSPLOWO2_02_FULL_44_10]